MPVVMSDDATVSFQVTLRKRTRNRFKSKAADLDVHMGPLSEALFTWFLETADSGKLPPALQQAIEKARADESKE